MKTIILMRQGEAETNSSSDHARTLTRAGRQDAERAGQQLVECGLSVELILSSTALRASETAKVVAAQFDTEIPIETVPELYQGDPSTYVEELQRLPKHLGCVALVAHNPTLSMLARAWSGTRTALSPAEWMVVTRNVEDWAALRVL